MPAKLPESLRQSPPPDCTIATMPVGAEYQFFPTAMIVDEDSNCWLEPDEKAGTAGFIAVRRDQDGYHVKVTMRGITWLPEKIPEKRRAKLLPVASVTLHAWGKGDQ